MRVQLGLVFTDGIFLTLRRLQLANPAWSNEGKACRTCSCKGTFRKICGAAAVKAAGFAVMSFTIDKLSVLCSDMKHSMDFLWLRRPPTGIHTIHTGAPSSTCRQTQKSRRRKRLKDEAS